MAKDKKDILIWPKDTDHPYTRTYESGKVTYSLFKRAGTSFEAIPVNFADWVKLGNDKSPLEKFLANVPKNTEAIIDFEDQPGGAGAHSHGKPSALYSAHGIALVPRLPNQPHPSDVPSKNPPERD